MEQVQKILLLDKSAFHITQKAEVLERKIGLLKDKLIN
jgi:hypothetical protein